MAKRALGKGLAALIPEQPQMGENIIPIELNKISPNPHQPRQWFNPQRLQELADSIKSKGLLAPLILTPHDGKYQLVAGDRRLRAAKLAGLKTVPAIIKKALSRQEQLEISLVENLQREDLNPIEEALAYQNLLRQFHLRQEDLSHRLGKPRSTVANILRLLCLPSDVKQALSEGKISEGHGRAILSAKGVYNQRRLSRAIIHQKLTVREAESLAEHLKQKIKPSKRKSTRSPEFSRWEEKLQRAFGTKVRIRRKKIELFYYSLEDLERLLSLLSGKR